jgi:SAM-dependent methyltransferase
VVPQPSKERVRLFWEAAPCGSAHGVGQVGSSEWYSEIERRRDQAEPFIPRFADFSGAAGQEVLEIGVGVGTDFIRWVRAGANATGVDLTSEAISLTRRRLELEGLQADLRTADAEALPFADGQFDRVYSWGVLHHTPNTERAVAEAIRVLKPGGTLTLMLYGRRSWVGYGLWLRYALLQGKPWLSLSDVIADHMESDGTRAFTFREFRALCSGLEDLTLRRVSTPYDRRVGGPLVSLLGDRLGWFIVATGRAPTPQRA